MYRKYIEYIEQLLDTAKRNDTFNLTSREFHEFSSWVEWSLELQIPRKVDTEVAQNGGLRYVCQSCWGFVGYLNEHCPNCGQAIGWGEE